MNVSMKINYATLNGLHESLSRFSSLTGKAGYTVGRNLMLLDSEFKLFTSCRDNLVWKYGIEDEETGMIAVKPGNPRAYEFGKEYAELLNTEVDVNIYKMEKSDYDPEALYCDTAEGRDYAIFSEWFVEKEDKEGDVDAEHV